MQIIKIILSVIFIIDCIALTVVVLMQEGKQQGLGAIAGAAETYWGKNNFIFCNFCSIKYAWLIRKEI